MIVSARALSSSSWTLALSFMLCVGVSAQQQAQTPQPAPLTLGAQLVILDATVVDKQGRSVLGLGKSDFTVFEDGVAQRVRSVDFSGDASQTSQSTARSISFTYILDELNTPFDDAGAARTALQQYLSRQPQTLAAPSMLLVVDDLGFHTLANSTIDRTILESTLRSHKPRLPLAVVQNDVDKQLTLSIETLQQLARAGGGLGRSVVIWIGRGTPGIDLNAVSADSAARARQVFDATTNFLLQNRVVLYRIDPAAAGYTFTSPQDQGLDQTFDSSPEPYQTGFSFATFAEQTGGRNLYGKNDIANEIQQVADSANSFYTIAYTPGVKRSDAPDYRHIRIVVDRPGLVAATRQGYYKTGVPSSSTSSASSVADEASRNNLTYGALALHILSVSHAAGGAPSKCIVSVQSDTLAWHYSDDGSRSAKLVLAAETFDAKHNRLSYAKSPVTISQRQADATEGGPLGRTSFSVSLRMPAQARSLRVVVVDDSSGKVGTDETPVLQPPATP